MCWILGGFATRFENKLARNDLDIGMLGIPLTWASTALLVVAGLNLIEVVTTVTEMQARNLSDMLEPEGSQD